MEKFREVVFDFSKAGTTLATYDHRGHGFSTRMLDPEKHKGTYVESFDDYANDMALMVDKAKTLFPGTEVVVYIDQWVEP